MAAPGRPLKAQEGSARHSGRIRVLERSVAEAIAAGEVIDRPAAAVKELIENSLDAGASRIVVELEAGGVDLIRVVDDGQGMLPEELSAAFLPHATSKLTILEDLLHLRTFGFRGEALPSIAAVGRVTVVSRATDKDRAHSLTLDGGEIRGPAVTAGAVGTSITVRDLFHSAPARRAFLRSARTEGAACVRVVAEAALSRPDVGYVVRSQGRLVLSCNPAGSLAATMGSVFGRDVLAGLLEVKLEDEGIEVTGLIGPPESARANRQAMVEMVNGRRIHHRGMTAAIVGAYRGMLPAERFPVSVINLRVDPSLVDVNVHPTKREVRFRDEGRVFQLVQRACWSALQGASPRAISLPAAVPLGTRTSFSQSVSPQFLEFSSGPAEPPFRADAELSLAEAAEWRYLGQAHNRYLLAETRSGLAVVDQHAAHEKVLYQSWLSALVGPAAGGFPAQGLLLPILIESDPGLLADALESGLDLPALGFEVTAFGEQTIRCSAAPAGLRPEAVQASLRELLQIAVEKEAEAGSRTHRLAASLACHSAVRFGDRLTHEQAQALLSDLAGTPGGITCPHGRPAVLLLTAGSLLAAFHRR